MEMWTEEDVEGDAVYAPTKVDQTVLPEWIASRMTPSVRVKAAASIIETQRWFGIRPVDHVAIEHRKEEAVSLCVCVCVCAGAWRVTTGGQSANARG